MPCCLTIISLSFTGANVDDRDPKVWAVLGKRIYGKLFADRGYISPNLSDALFADGVHLVTGIRNNMKNKLMPLWDKIILMNLIAALGAYCFFDNKPEAIQGYYIEDTNQLSLF